MELFFTPDILIFHFKRFKTTKIESIFYNFHPKALKL